MREKEIEQYLVREVRKLGGKAFKWVSPGWNGVPDRIVFFPKRQIYFVELKRPNNKLSSLQELTKRFLKDFGWDVLVIDSKSKVDDFISEVKT